MAEHNKLGKKGEEIAVAHLQERGYVILETNWRAQSAEIDIIAKKGNTLVVVEVKTRSSIEYGLPQDFVKPAQIQRLVKAIDQYITIKNLDLEVRFDIIAINKIFSDYNVEHIEDAFYFF
ncbi:YraN family protein [Flavobacterium sp. SUN046]|uniref:YraN family protein n=1 Tax=Flavobacterium sp. SUN046 TaxID=3002440 RepID=UPI002DB93CE3|nr:YraN family protein [Flavobacterium sp. SUN046]MEC4048255.1 YraN family protein [Flavobacterium sp. SUN046]